MDPQASLFISKNPHKVHQQSIGRTTHIRPSIVILIMDLTVRMILQVIPDKKDQENQCGQTAIVVLMNAILNIRDHYL